ncbi:MAG: ROK family transcriptional regulator [Desulfobulbaceae bacterium]|nr:MAG: ROK family transcriptional regulator [Desulfobulbaceae bacterium]
MGANKNASLTVRNFQKALHRSTILDLIRTNGLISRTELARQTRLSQASVTGITADLRDEGLIEEKQTGVSEGGRKPILLAINPDGVHVIGVNLSIGQVRVVIINFQAELKASYITPLEKDYYSPEEMVDIIAQAIQACMWESNYSRDQIAGVGVGIPGPVDARTGTIRFLPNYGWSNIAFRDLLRSKINHPVFIDNSANNLAIAEHWFGGGKGINNFLVVTLENGVGAGLVVNGQLLRGHQGIASEFGHTCADPDGPLCRCGRKGCIEAFVGNNSIIRDCKTLIKQGKWSGEIADPDKLVFTDVLAELKHGNKELELIYKKAGEVLGIGIYNLVTLLNPELVIITGKGTKSGAVLFDPMFKILETYKKGEFGFEHTKIIIQGSTDLDMIREGSNHGGSDGDWAKESGTLVLREIYKSPTII